MKPFHALVFSGLLVILALPVAQAVTYKWLDEQGNVVYSQTPPPDGTAYEILDTIKPSRTPPKSAPTAQTSKAVADLQASEKERKANQDLASEQAKNAELRAKNCASAKQNLETYTVYKRIRQPDGSVKRIPDDERERKIKEYQQAVKEFCE